MNRIPLLVLILALGLCACIPAGGMDVYQPWARPARQGENGAVYFVLENQFSETQELIAAMSDVAEAVEIHETRMSGDVMQMHRLEAVPLEPGAEVIFEPGGLHVMLIGLRRELKIGDEIEITLQFTDFEDLTVQVPVQDAPANAGEH